MNNQSDVCCPEFHPGPWDEKTHLWQNKLFLKDEVRQLFHIPLNMGQVITHMWQQVEAAKAGPKTEEFLILAHDPSPWKSELYMTVTKNIPGTNIVKLNGTFVSKVFEGPYQAVPQWLVEMDKYLAGKKEKSLKYYIHYTYCPKCAKKYGHNYGVVFAQVK